MTGWIVALVVLLAGALVGAVIYLARREKEMGAIDAFPWQIPPARPGRPVSLPRPGPIEAPLEEPDDDEDGGDPMVSLVLLRSRPRNLTQSTLAHIAGRVFDLDLSSEDPDATDFVVGESPILLVKARGLLLTVHDMDRPYVEDPNEVARGVSDLRLRRAMAGHSAWLAVDLMNVPDPADPRAAYRYVGQLIAALVDDHSLAIYAPATQRLNVVDAELLAKLRGDDPLAAVAELTHVPVVHVDEDDPRMARAVEEARRTWPEFRRAFARRCEGDIFLVKGPFRHRDNTEFIWVEVDEIRDEGIRGRLSNAPAALPDLAMGDWVEVKLEDLNDWIYDDGELHGGFTVKVIEDAQEP